MAEHKAQAAKPRRLIVVTEHLRLSRKYHYLDGNWKVVTIDFLACQYSLSTSLG
jgi:hypothetical protein